jgi:hypothetical protein
VATQRGTQLQPIDMLKARPAPALPCPILPCPPPACPALPLLELQPLGVHACVYTDAYMQGACSSVAPCRRPQSSFIHDARCNCMIASPPAGLPFRPKCHAR